MATTSTVAPQIAYGVIAKIDEEKQLVFGWASVIRDTDGRILLDRQNDFIDSEDELEKAAYEYVLKSRDGGEMHIRKGVSTMVESVVLSLEKQRALGIPTGTVPVGWWVGFKVNDERVWGEVKKGGYVGFSVHGTGRRDTTMLSAEQVTEIGKCNCGGVAKYEPRYWTTMAKAISYQSTSILEKAKRKKGGNKIRVVMREFKRGKLKSSSGKTVTDPKQAMAIAISEQKRMKKGDSPGHPFRGNQWTGGRGGGGSAGAGAKASKRPKMKRGASIIKVKTVEEGVKLVLEGKDVEMPDIKGAHTLIEKLAEMAIDAEKSGKKVVYDLCRVSVKGTNAFCLGNKGIPRDQMPQAKGEVVEGSKADKALKKKNAKRAKEGKEPKTEYDATEEFVAHLEKAGIKASKPKRMRADKLKATQRDMQGEKVGGMMKAKDFDPSAEPIFVSRDGYVVDGHHRWAATLGRDMRDGILGNDQRQNVIVLDAPISRIIKEANRFTTEFGIKRKTVAANKKKSK
jgi:hypothetical protein